MLEKVEKGYKEQRNGGYKKAAIICIIVLLIGIISFYIYITFPSKISLTYYGVLYQLGNSEHTEKINVKIDGKYYPRIFSEDFFQGNITIGDETFENRTLYMGIEHQSLRYPVGNLYGDIY